MKFLKELFAIERNPMKGLMAVEWAAMGYLVLTLVVTLFLYTRLPHPETMIWGRGKIVAMTLALWLAYRIIPCRFIRFARVAAQLALLAWWYPDTFELNRTLPNLDHLFASWEQQLFGCQPALLFSELLPGAVASELFDMGYAAYYPMIVFVVIYYFLFRNNEFERAAFIVITAFFLYYVMFIFIPVAGPTFYFKAVGVKNIVAGVFPNIHDYFNYHQECLTSPGYTDGIFYHFVEDAKAAGERPTAAFPSSHVGISTVIMWLVWHARNGRLLLLLSPFYVLLCCATVYIQAHYLVDAIAGLLTGTFFFFLLLAASKKMKG